MMHIHNGDVVAALARRSDIPGEHVVFRESLVTGAIVPGDDWIEIRAHAIADAHGEDLLRVRTSLFEQEQLLDAAPSREEIVLWFEHDLFCLIHLVYLLQRLSGARISLVWSRAPLSNKDEEELYTHFESREAATPALIDLASAVWHDYAAADPRGLNRWVEGDRWREGDPWKLPFLREGLTLHASRFPSRNSGLGAVERRLLDEIAGGAEELGRLIDLMLTDAPRLGFGDTEILRLLRAMSECAVPLVTMTGEPPKATFAITPAGEKVLGGEVDNVKINDPDAWLGGAHLTKETLWRWDDRARRIV